MSKYRLGSDDEYLSDSGSYHTNNNSEQFPITQPPIEEIDDLADELADEYDNHQFRSWYCGLIKDFGVERVQKWQRRATNGDNPGKLFSKYAKQALQKKNAEQLRQDTVATKPAGPEKPLNKAETQAKTDYEQIKSGLSEALGIELQDKPKTDWRDDIEAL